MEIGITPKTKTRKVNTRKSVELNESLNQIDEEDEKSVDLSLENAYESKQVELAF